MNHMKLPNENGEEVEGNVLGFSEVSLHRIVPYLYPLLM